MRWLVPEDRALVLGSTQAMTDVDPVRAERAQVSVLRRRSGGGAVLVAPRDVLWVDVFVPTDDALWDPDVGRAFWWLGDTWVSAFASIGVTAATAWRGRLQNTAWSRRVCFAGMGPGEVSVNGAKVVGISQRRSREGALFQCAVLVRWDPLGVVDLLALGDCERQEAAHELAALASGLGPQAVADLAPAFRTELGRLG